jgi:hypothetical protein
MLSTLSKENWSGAQGFCVEREGVFTNSLKVFRGRDMQTPGQSVEAMLLKYTRKTQPTTSSAAIYTAR